MNQAARPANAAGGELWCLLGCAVACAGVWFWHYWELLLNSDGGGFGDMGVRINCIAASMFFTLFVIGIGVLNTCTARNFGVLVCVFGAIGLYFGVMIIESHIGKQIWEQELAENQAIADDAIERILAHVKMHGKTPISLADVGLVEPIELKRGDHTHELEYWRQGDNAFTVTFAYGWYRHFWDSEAGHWDMRD
jgi:hypothetical protein